jgi:hypothetical protein
MAQKFRDTLAQMANVPARPSAIIPRKRTLNTSSFNAGALSGAPSILGFNVSDERLP